MASRSPMAWLRVGNDLRAPHGVPERPKISFKPLIFKGFFVFDVP